VRQRHTQGRRTYQTSLRFSVRDTDTAVPDELDPPGSYRQRNRCTAAVDRAPTTSIKKLFRTTLSPRFVAEHDFGVDDHATLFWLRPVQAFPQPPRKLAAHVAHTDP